MLLLVLTLAVGWVGGSPSSAGVLCWRARVFVISICGGVERTESGVSGVGGEYDWDTDDIAGT